MRRRGGAPKALPGGGVADVWRPVLREPDRYRLITPTQLLGAELVPEKWSPWRQWLARGTAALARRGRYEGLGPSAS